MFLLRSWTCSLSLTTWAIWRLACVVNVMVLFSLLSFFVWQRSWSMVCDVHVSHVFRYAGRVHAKRIFSVDYLHAGCWHRGMFEMGWFLFWRVLWPLFIVNWWFSDMCFTAHQNFFWIITPLFCFLVCLDDGFGCKLLRLSHFRLCRWMCWNEVLSHQEPGTPDTIMQVGQCSTYVSIRLLSTTFGGECDWLAILYFGIRCLWVSWDSPFAGAPIGLGLWQRFLFC